MSKKELLALMRLLSALESWGLSNGKPLPDYLHAEIGRVVDLVENEILGDHP